MYVAPYVGAWIETHNPPWSDQVLQSHPTWVRGLKPEVFRTRYQLDKVAPYVGAWIETAR